MGTLNIKQLISDSENDKLVLPNFQRAFEWDRNAQCQLLASVVFNIPIGSVLILVGDKDYFATKKMCFLEGEVESRETCHYLLDGQQRISSLKSIFYDFFKDVNNWVDIYEKMYPKLRNRWFIKIKPENNEEDIFGWKNLRFEGVKKFEPKEIIPLLVCKNIYKNKKEEWYHPEYYLTDENDQIVKENKRILQIVKCAAKEGLVPLYTIYDCALSNQNDYSKSLHYKVLSKIAEDRLEELKAEVLDEKVSIYEILEGYIEEEIDEIEEYEKYIERAWDNLRNDWVVSVFNFIQSSILTEISVIELPKEEMSRAIYAFEYINRGGMSLSNYDLIVAKAALDRNKQSLTDRIKEVVFNNLNIPDSIVNGLKNISNNYVWSPNSMELISDKDGGLISSFKNQYLNLLSIFSYSEYGKFNELKLDLIKKQKILDLDYKQINDNTEITVQSIIRALAFLQFRCGIVKMYEINYELMILPIAYCLKDDSIWTNSKCINKIEYWYWVSLFAGAYRERQNEQCIHDIEKLYLWLKNDISTNPFIEKENKVLNVDEYSNLNTLLNKDLNKGIPKAISKGILQYILSRQPFDFTTENKILSSWDISSNDDLVIEEHHIIPLGSAKNIGQSSRDIRSNTSHILNCPLNKTYISKKANRIISDMKPSEYFQYVESLKLFNHCIDTIDEIKNNLNDYEFILKRRYDLIKNKLLERLNELK